MNEKDYWNKRYHTGGSSGYGSYGEQLEKKLDWITPLEYKTITEVGCGDFNFGKNLLERHPATYTGLDIAQIIIERNSNYYPEHRFLEMGKEIPRADLILCVDVLYHILDDNEYKQMLNQLDKAWTKYLVLTAYERDEDKDNHVRIRKFDPKQFGVPILREIVEENGQLYFYIFKR